MLPPRERRCLLLIDPPYENPAAELEQATQALVSSLQRLANCVIMLWYPIKDERTLAPWLARVEQALTVPTLSLELWIYPRDSRVGLNGSGLLLVNPPYQFEQRACAVAAGAAGAARPDAARRQRRAMAGARFRRRSCQRLTATR